MYTWTVIIGIGRFHPESIYIFSPILIGWKISSLDLPEIYDHHKDASIYYQNNNLYNYIIQKISLIVHFIIYIVFYCLIFLLLIFYSRLGGGIVPFGENVLDFL